MTFRRCRVLPHQFVEPFRDLLPGGDALRVTIKDKRADLLRDIKRTVLTLGLDYLIGAGPQFPFGELQRSRDTRLAAKP